MIKSISPYLSGQLLVAMPGMIDPRFSRAVIYVCSHNAEGAMGIVINRSIDSISFSDILEQLDINIENSNFRKNILLGGPVETSRGFILHSCDFTQNETLIIDDNTALTATVDILEALAQGKGPSHSLLALGYAGWGPGQLDSEIKSNGWLNVESDGELLYGGTLELKWNKALDKIGIDHRMLSNTSGNA